MKIYWRHIFISQKYTASIEQQSVIDTPRGWQLFRRLQSIDLLQTNPKSVFLPEPSLLPSQEKLVQLEPRHRVLDKFVTNAHFATFFACFCGKRDKKTGWWSNSHLSHLKVLCGKEETKTWLMGSTTMALPVHSSFASLGCRGWATDPFTWVLFGSGSS